MKTYEGLREASLGKATVTVREGTGRAVPLDPRHDIRSHSPGGFQWSYSGSGPAQLALALLCDCLGVEEAQRYYQDFKSAVFAPLAVDHWVLTEADIRSWVERHKREAAWEREKE